MAPSSFLSNFQRIVKTSSQPETQGYITDEIGKMNNISQEILKKKEAAVAKHAHIRNTFVIEDVPLSEKVAEM